MCFGKIKLNDDEIEFEFTEEDGIGNTIRIKNQNGQLEEVNQFKNLNYSVIESIFTESTNDYKELELNDFWDLRFDKKLWEEDGLLEEVY